MKSEDEIASKNTQSQEIEIERDSRSLVFYEFSIAISSFHSHQYTLHIITIIFGEIIAIHDCIRLK